MALLTKGSWTHDKEILGSTYVFFPLMDTWKHGNITEALPLLFKSTLGNFFGEKQMFVSSQ